MAKTCAMAKVWPLVMPSRLGIGDVGTASAKGPQEFDSDLAPRRRALPLRGWARRRDRVSDKDTAAYIVPRTQIAYTPPLKGLTLYT